MSAQIRVGDVGTDLVVRVLDEDGEAVDISAASVKTIKLKAPGADAVSLTAELDTTGADGRMKYVSLAATFPAAGEYRIQGYVEVGAAKFHTEPATFDVGVNL